tara:strand:- start:27219 stop:29699 length:2481 start_codon:yes stop_codon:yes gene_type:complete
VAIILGQAIYGERDRGHRILAASPAFHDGEKLAGRMDLQGSPPPYTQWQPYVSGFARDGYYVFARTMPDPRAARAGMVFSRAFALPLAQAATLGDIGGIFDLLASLGDNRESIEDRPYEPGSVVMTPGSVGLAKALLAQGPDPVVWPGQAGFEAALTCLWARLWPASRIGLTFRIAFSPTDVSGEAPAIVTTPPELVARWSAYRVVDANAVRSPSDRAEGVLLGDPIPPDLTRVLDDFGPQTRCIADLRDLASLAELAGGGGSPADYLDALRLACHLAPEPAKGRELKAQLVSGAASAIGTATVGDVRMARNLDLASIEEPGAFWTALGGWARSELWRVTDAEGLSLILQEAKAETPVPEWRLTIWQGVRSALGKPTQAMAAALWGAVTMDPTLLATLAGKSKRTRSALEGALVSYPPVDLAAASAEKIAAAASELEMPSLHALVCAMGFAPLEAIRRHMLEAQADAQTLAIAALRASAADLVAAALEHDDELTLALGAQAAADAPKLLRRIDVADGRWRDLWAGALAIDIAAASGPINPDKALTLIFDGVIEGSVVADDLLAAISVTPLAALVDYPRRAELWPRVREPARGRLIAATAEAWLARIEAGDDVVSDAVLSEAVADPVRLEPTLRRLTGTVVSGCRLVRALPQLTERRFERWLSEVLRRGQSLASEEAEALGRLVAARHWDPTAERIAIAITDEDRSDLRPAVDFIIDRLSYYRRYLLDETFSRTPLAAKWQILEEVALELYPWGPGDESLWRRAGGKESDIPKAPTGADAWRKVMNDAQKGRGAVNFGRLIKVMHDDFPHNRALSKLRWDSAFGFGW